MVGYCGGINLSMGFWGGEELESKVLQELSFELRRLDEEIKIHREKEQYVYTGIYKDWVERSNALLKKYNAIRQWDIKPFKVKQTDLSGSKKTIKETALDNFQCGLRGLIDEVDGLLTSQENSERESQIPHHQMRKCFKTGHGGCPLNPAYRKNEIFVAMPFDDKYQDSFTFGIVMALEGVGLEHYRADGEITTKDIMCKICERIQSCRLMVANISGLNPNVMLELGLAYGLGKPVIIVKDKETKTISDLGSIEYIEYTHSNDLAQKLHLALTNL